MQDNRENKKTLTGFPTHGGQLRLYRQTSCWTGKEKFLTTIVIKHLPSDHTVVGQQSELTAVLVSLLLIV